MEDTTEDKKVNIYEIAFLATASENVGVIQKLLAGLKAEVINEGPVSEIQLAYSIEKKTSAYFGYIHFKLETSGIEKINDALRLDKNILRFLIITPIPAKPIPRRIPETSPRPVKKAAAGNDLTNEALEEKLAALQGKA